MGGRSVTTDPARPPTGEPPRWRIELRAFGELLALSGLAIAQPLFDIFGRAPEHFIFRGAETGDIILFGLLVVLVPPALAYLIEIGLGIISPRAREIGHVALIGLFAAMFLTLVLDGLLFRTAAIIGAIALATLVVLVYQRTRGLRIWLAFLSPAPLAFLVLFLTASPVASLLGSQAEVLDVAVDDPRPTVVLVLDEFPLSTLLDADGDIDADLFPNFARLADSSHWFRQATTITNTTVRAVPAMLTGKIPEREGSPTSNTYPDNLFTLVGGSMPVTSSEVLTAMCPNTVCDHIASDGGGLTGLLGDARDVLHQRLSPTDPDVDPLSTQVEGNPGDPAPAEGAGDHRGGGEDAGVSRYARFLRSLEQGSTGLHFFHLMLPHRPHQFLPDGNTYNVPSPALGRFLESWSNIPEPVTGAHQQFLLQLQWTDTLVGELIDTLQDAGTWDDTTVVVLADHGFGYEPGGPVRAMTADNDSDDAAMAEILWVPFFVKTPGQTAGEISDDPVRIVDLTPTLADVLDFDIPWETDGRSVFEGGSGDPDEVGLFRSVAGEGHAGSAYRALDRDLGHRLLLERTTGIIAPPHDGITGSDRIYAIGPRPDLFGRPAPADATRLDVVIHPESRTDDVDPPPIVFRADTAASDIGRDVAITVDGTVWASATVHDDGGGRILAFIPPRAFDDGPNELAVLALP